MHEHAFTGHKNNAPLYRREPNTVRFATISILSTLQGFRVTPQEPPVRHLDTTISWPAALTIWLLSGGALIVTSILSLVGLVLNVFSVGHQERQSISWAAFDSPAPSSVIIFIVLGIAWLAFTQGWCFMAGAAFRSTYKRAYIGNVILNILLIAAVVMWAIVAFQ